MSQLEELRQSIDRVDGEICALFEERMDLAHKVAAYKREHRLPIFQSGREEEVLRRIESLCSEENKSGGRVLFTNLIDISKCLQAQDLERKTPIISLVEECLSAPANAPNDPKLACQGVAGAYSHLAARKMFPDNRNITFFPTFEGVFDAVQNEEVDFGILPVENSNAGSVIQVYQPMRRHSFYIRNRLKIRADHCLCARPGVTQEDIREIYSHPQAILQCGHFLDRLSHAVITPYNNTAMAAKLVSESDRPIAAICSALCAELYGLTVLESSIQDNPENFTRFVCITKRLRHDPDANRITVSFTLPKDVNGALYRLLSKFAVHGVNMSRIESVPIGSRNFDVMFYVDLDGNIAEPRIRRLLGDLEEEMVDLKFLGNYRDTSIEEKTN